MDGGAVAIIVACLFILAIVALIAVAIAFLVKYALIIIPAVFITKIFGGIADKKHKRRR